MPEVKSVHADETLITSLNNSVSYIGAPKVYGNAAELIAASRPDFDVDGLVQQLPSAAGRIHHMEIPALAISSSDIRARVARGAPIVYLVPEGVARYIQKRALYR